MDYEMFPESVLPGLLEGVDYDRPFDGPFEVEGFVSGDAPNDRMDLKEGFLEAVSVALDMLDEAVTVEIRDMATGRLVWKRS